MSELIEKLLAVCRPHMDGNIAGDYIPADQAIAIVREHFADPQLVQRVARAISAWRWDQKTDEPWERLKATVQQAYRDQAAAAIAAMGDGSAPIAPGAESATAQLTPTSQPVEYAEEAQILYEAWMNDGGRASILALAHRCFAAGVATKRESGWRPIKSAPKDGTVIFLATYRCAAFYCSWQKGGWRMWGQDDFDGMGWIKIDFTPTHWMKAPELPQMEGEAP